MKILLPFAIVFGIIFAFVGLSKFWNDYKPKENSHSQSVVAQQDTDSISREDSLQIVHSQRPGKLVHPDGVSYRDGQLTPGGRAVVSRDISQAGTQIVIDPDRDEAVHFCSYSEHRLHGPVIGVCRGGGILEYWKGRKIGGSVVLSVSRHEVRLLMQTGAILTLFPI
jgi:hypothetical protein